MVMKIMFRNVWLYFQICFSFLPLFSFSFFSFLFVFLVLCSSIFLWLNSIIMLTIGFFCFDDCYLFNVCVCVFKQHSLRIMFFTLKNNSHIYIYINHQEFIKERKRKEWKSEKKKIIIFVPFFSSMINIFVVFFFDYANRYVECIRCKFVGFKSMFTIDFVWKE